MPSDEIFLVDAYAQIYRGYYAIPALNNSKGIPSNAVFGLAKFILRMMKELEPAYGAFVFDKGVPAQRLTLAPDYKANRSPMPDEMRTQIPYIRHLISALGWPICELEGFEADDLLAGVTNTFPNDRIGIISPDKDLSQLVNERVRILIPDPKTGMMNQRGEAEILAKFDVMPFQITAYLSLTGDNSDNIPGVPGVGPKTAAALISEFGTLDNLINSAESIKNQKLKEKIQASTELLRKNMQLVSLYATLPGEEWHSKDKFKLAEPDTGALLELFNELELKSLITEIEKIRQKELCPSVENDHKKPGELYTPDLF